MRRPVEYSKEMAEEIFNAIAFGTKSIEKLCKENKHWPNVSTILSWRKSNKDFFNLYTTAKQYQIEALIDEILHIADDRSNDQFVNEHGKMVFDVEHIQRSKVRIDTRKWLAAKLCPRLYGDLKPEENNNQDLILDLLKLAKDKQ